ncbi:hypothetical protein RHMOL_Rhmol04G0324000 [Rhododendron molle]|uniref:Uncharacterized protein n=1 Tax=Rhododendron molle TaxID=49168 RepID=A0ACC0P6T0_RHOML|nr:hypothetical protein RHMOL_Rhmol04G0324000 [Rhododendron molle]
MPLSKIQILHVGLQSETDWTWCKIGFSFHPSQGFDTPLYFDINVHFRGRMTEIKNIDPLAYSYIDLLEDVTERSLSVLPCNTDASEIISDGLSSYQSDDEGGRESSDHDDNDHGSTTINWTFLKYHTSGGSFKRKGKHRGKSHKVLKLSHKWTPTGEVEEAGVWEEGGVWAVAKARVWEVEYQPVSMLSLDKLKCLGSMAFCGVISDYLS